MRSKKMDGILKLFKDNPHDNRLQPADYLMLINHFDEIDNQDQALLTTGFFTARYCPKIVCSALMDRGMLEFAEGRYDDAIETLTKVIETDPTSIHAYVVRGCAYGLSRRDDRGIRAMEDMITAGQLVGTSGGIIV